MNVETKPPSKPTVKMAATGQNSQIPQANSSARESRVATHSHIRGLGLKEDGSAVVGTGSAGWVGQTTAREVRIIEGV